MHLLLQSLMRSNLKRSGSKNAAIVQASCDHSPEAYFLRSVAGHSSAMTSDYCVVAPLPGGGAPAVRFLGIVAVHLGPSDFPLSALNEHSQVA